MGMGTMGKDALPHRKTCKRWDRSWDAHAITFSCFRRQAFLSRPRACRWFLDALDQARAVRPFDLWGFTIMPEHVHLLILPHEDVTISAILSALKQPVAKRALVCVRRYAPGFLETMADCRPNGRVIHRFWQRGGGYDRNLRSTRDVHEKLRYIHDNPVRRGLRRRAEDWQWSSCRAWQSGVDDLIRIDRDTFPILET
jgi:putative transposase